MKGLEKVCDLIKDTVDPEWEKIKCVTSKEWEDDFNEYLDNLFNSKRKSKSPKLKPKSMKNESFSIDHLNEFNRYKLCYDLFNLMEGVWLEGRKKLNSIRQMKKGEPLDLDELIDYSFRIRSTTFSPPENTNIDDPTRHYDLFPQYHFLGIPNTSQMHMSRLFSLSRLENQCSAPVVTFELVSEDTKRMKIVCETPNSVVYFQTSRESNVPCTRTGNYLTYSTDPAVYDENKSYKFKVDANPFTVHAWATCEGMRQSTVVNVKYESEFKMETKVKSEEFDLMLSRKK